MKGYLVSYTHLGYAERNPEADVEGYDTCRKIAILTAMATGKEVDLSLIHICSSGCRHRRNISPKKIAVSA